MWPPGSSLLAIKTGFDEAHGSPTPLYRHRILLEFCNVDPRAMTIFYADDKEIFDMVIRALVPDVKLITARDGKEAIAVLSDTTDVFDAIFLDLNMPLMNGLECLKELRAMDRYKRTTVVLYSTTSAKSEKEMAISAGADKVFVKPNGLDEIKDQLRQALSRYLP